MSYKKIYFLIFLPLFSIFLLSCNHLQSSCLEVNWYEIGRQDSTRGIEWKQAFSERQRFCYIKEESSQAKAHKNGFNAGIREYCNFRTAYIYGLSKTEHKIESCPPSLREVFKKGYESGQQMAKIQKLENSIKDKVSSIEAKYRVLAEKQAEKKAAQKDEKQSDKQAEKQAAQKDEKQSDKQAEKKADK